MGDIGPAEILIIGIVIVLLFGATRLPKAAKGLGQALRIFKHEIRGDNDPAPAAATASASVPATVPAAIGPGSASEAVTQPLDQATKPSDT